MSTATAAPHSRWFLQAKAAQLTASHADVAAAIRALTVAEARRDRPRAWRPVLHRIRAWGWLRAIRLSVAITLTALLLGWTSVRLIGHLAALPALVSVIPGVLLTAALVASASYAARPLRYPATGGISYPWLAVAPLAVTCASLIAWVAVWLALISGAATWLAVTVAIALTAALAVVMVICGYQGMPSGAVELPAGGDAPVRPRLTRRARTWHKRARKRLDSHTSDWTEVTHRYAAVIAGASQAERSLARLIDGDGERFPLDDVDPYDVIILSVLQKCHPAPLAVALDAVAERL
jgi:hypothetical protein